MGMPFTTRMSVVQLRDGSVWVSSPVPLPYEARTEVTSLGPVRYLVSPTPRHFWRLARWHMLFPDAELWSSPMTPFTLKRGDLPLTGVLGAGLPRSWAPELDHVVLGSSVLQESAFLHAPSGTLLIEDAIQVHNPRPRHPISNTVFRLGGVMGPDGGVSRDLRLTFRPRTTARESVLHMLDWDFDTVVLAHGPIVTEKAKEFVARAFNWLID
ncbi:DUF4336 domain-containing protein [Microbacter sp. GSS18]|nr:DUF4336 domain-containing protein [Microbacter sp. GSS18]